MVSSFTAGSALVFVVVVVLFVSLVPFQSEIGDRDECDVKENHTEPIGRGGGFVVQPIFRITVTQGIFRPYPRELGDPLEQSRKFIRVCRSSCRHAQRRNFSSSTKLDATGLPNCAHSPTPYKGASYERVMKSRECMVTTAQKPFYKKPLLLHEGRGQWLWDHEGKRYLDMFAGIATVSVGHCHPKVVEAATQQSRQLGHTTAVYLHPRYHEYAEKLTSKLPAPLSCVYLTNSGSEATELAIQLARIYTGRHEVVSLRNCYHGGTGVAASATCMSVYKYPIMPLPGHVHVANPDVYRGPWGGRNCRDSPCQANRDCACTGNKCEAEDRYLEQFDELYRTQLPSDGKIAAFTAESIQGVGGTVQFPRNYLRRVYEAVRSRGGLCIADEVQTGFARTGTHFWGFEAHGVRPDIVVMAKGIGNGYPLGAVVTTPEVSQALARASYFNTYAGNPVACAVGNAVVQVIEEESLQENAHTVGTQLLHDLASLMREFPETIGDVRGKGLMIGVELVADPETREFLPADDVAFIFEDIKDSGVLIGRGGVKGNVFRFKPPLCVTKEDATCSVDVFRAALKKFRAQRKR
ncbi:alanine--glyoxylate aminotransferase 2, mitochondrial isoform X1 [Trichogramma pretiosum]|uniref:alanine--glyoxylate aminotransferase 2, mitochondrial isoform X1 n=1 Tax=Trichogramma pretiosum TaxID=7493 RepID=UPI0006C9A79A|nr:alanine--glyoxylate aminotransferase 2, mitochondrial isoform X1 [Trichogramma pretiosum]